jgi:enterochelin esterase-like enzyme
VSVAHRLSRLRAESFCWFVGLLLVLAFCLGGLLPLARRDQGHNIITHDVSSNYQSGSTKIRVLLPDMLDDARPYRVVYVLPVSAQLTEQRDFGDILVELNRLGLHNKSNLIFVQPTFSATPWYGDHPLDRTIRQESHMIDFVVPFVDSVYPTLDNPDGRLLLGFSKSGWGAWSLLLRHPGVFGRAAAWDAPLMLKSIGPWDTPTVFGDQGNFEQYRVSDLVRTQGANLGPATRLLLLGHGVFEEHVTRMAHLLTTLGIPHEYSDGPGRKHDWLSGWIPSAFDLLLSQPPLPKLTPRQMTMAPSCPECKTVARASVQPAHSP